MRLLDALFSPRRVALVGASEKPGSLGRLLTTNLDSFPGEVVLLGSGQSLRDVDGVIDLAVVAVPAAAVAQVVADGGATGVHVMVVLSGGFAESGPEGAQRQEELLRAAEGPHHRVRIIGPNCFGVQNCDLPLNASIASGSPTGGGGISFISQSGAYGMAIHDMAHDENVRFAKVCAPGNTSDVTVSELLEALGDDDATSTICLLLESLPDGRDFVERARRITPHKPVIVLKTGRSEAGARAAASHTAALASREALWHGAFRQAGVVEVRSGQELLDTARAVDGQPLPQGDRVAIITNSGGTGVELADLLSDESLVVPELSEDLQSRIRQLLPPYASSRNPVDVTPAWSLFATVYPELVDMLARSGEVDAVVTVLLQRSATDGATVEGVARAAQALRSEGVLVPVYACWVAPRSAQANADALQGAGVPVLPWPPRTARAIGRARDIARRQQSPHDTRGSSPSLLLPDAESLADDPLALAAVLRSVGVPVVTTAICTTAEEAVLSVESYPSVVKVAKLAHRSDVGGVRLNLRDAQEVGEAATDLLAMSEAVLVSPHLSGVEVAVGAFRDPSFGPVVMVGIGGIWVEVFGDVAFAVAPVTRREAEELVGTLRGHALLSGGRGQPATDLVALADVVVALGDALIALPSAESLELNPVLATPEGVIAVDWKLTLGNQIPLMAASD